MASSPLGALPEESMTLLLCECCRHPNKGFRFYVKYVITSSSCKQTSWSVWPECPNIAPSVEKRIQSAITLHPGGERPGMRNVQNYVWYAVRKRKTNQMVPSWNVQLAKKKPPPTVRPCLTLMNEECGSRGCFLSDKISSHQSAASRINPKLLLVRIARLPGHV